MAERPRLRVHVPGTVASRPVTPGPNSWAISVAGTSGLSDQPTTKSQPTNRSKYEDKPMPPLPLDSIQSHQRTKTNESGALFDVAEINALQIRAFTDPFITRPTTASDLSGTMSNFIEWEQGLVSEAKDQILTPDQVAESVQHATSISQDDRELIQRLSQSTVPQPKTSSKPSAQPPSSAPAFTGTPHLYNCGDQSHIEERTSGLPNHEGQATSTPVPIRSQSLDETNPGEDMDLATAAAMLRSARQSYPENGNDERNGRGLFFGNGFLHPTSNGAYGLVGGCEVVDGIHQARINSCVGLIEGNEVNPMREPLQGGPPEPRSRPCASPPEIPSSDVFTADWCTSNGYGEIGKHYSNVGHIPPPFHPHTLHSAQHFLDRMSFPSENSSAAAHPPPDESKYQRSTLSNGMSARLANSWASSSDNMRDDTSQTNVPVSATVPPLFARLKLGNSVPTPPHSSYQPHSGPPSAELSRLELNMHHHIDTVFGSLTRLIINKQDQAVDQTIRRIEKLEKRVDKALKLMKEMKESLEIHNGERTSLLREIRMFPNGQAKKPYDLLNDSAPQHNPEGNGRDEGSRGRELKPRPQRSQSVLVSPSHRIPDRIHKPSRSDANSHEVFDADIQRSYMAARNVGQSEGMKASKNIFARGGIPRSNPPDIRNHPALREVHAAAEDHSNGSPTRNSQVFYQPSFFCPQAQPGWYTKAFGE